MVRLLGPLTILTSGRLDDPFEFTRGSIPPTLSARLFYLDEPLSIEIRGPVFHLAQNDVVADLTPSPDARIAFLPASFDLLLQSWSETRMVEPYLKRLHWNELIALLTLCGAVKCLNSPFCSIPSANKLALNVLLPTQTDEIYYGLNPEARRLDNGQAYLFKAATDTSKIEGEYRIEPRVFEKVPRVDDQRPTGIWQRFLSIDEEFRCYSFVNREPLLFRVPNGDATTPDSRFLPRQDYSVERVFNSRVESVITSACATLGVDFAAIDVAREGDRLVILDVNPHASWSWLPSFAAELVRASFADMLHNFCQSGSRK